MVTCEIRALWWKQPYAQLMLHGKIETRVWDTSYRGKVLICASKKGYTDKELLRVAGAQHYKAIKELFRGRGLYHGYAIAVGELEETRIIMGDGGLLGSFADTYVQYSNDYENLFAHHYANVRAIKPIPIDGRYGFRGSLGWRSVPQEIINQIEYL